MSESTQQQARMILVITGLSGAGKSYASHVLEDAGYYCVDNLPPDLIKQFVELAFQSGKGKTRLALVCDVRGGTRFQDLFESLNTLEHQGVAHRIVFLEASEEVLLRRFSETRRRHPLDSGTLRDDIRRERELLADIRTKADIIIDTSTFSVSRLKEKMLEVTGMRTQTKGMNVVVSSFGFKYGVPSESDLVFDVRFLPNPHYVAELAPLTGKDERIQNYVLDSDTSRDFSVRFLDFIDFLMPQFTKEGKSHLTIAIGCTGGRHRSVTFAEILASHLRASAYHVRVSHRDLAR